MVAVKLEAQEMIRNLSDDCTYEDIQYHLFVVGKIKNGEVVSHEEVKQLTTLRHIETRF